MYDVEMYVYEFTKLKAATRLCMYVRRVYVYEFTDPNVTTRVCVYVCCENVCYVFTESIVTTRNYVIRKFYGNDVCFVLLMSPSRLQ